jgi:GNAT superfamily N-acetyltransferase
MKRVEAGETVDVTVTYLEMDAPPSYDRPSTPLGAPVALIRAEEPPVWYFLQLYEVVGRDYEWVDRLQEPTEKVEARFCTPDITIYTLLRKGWPHGFFMLDTSAHPTCDLAYFGLVREAIGLRLGSYLLKTALHTAWDIPGVNKLTVNTCTLDHPRALQNYQKAGFDPVRQEVYSRTLTRAWDPGQFP